MYTMDTNTPHQQHPTTPNQLTLPQPTQVLNEPACPPVHQGVLVLWHLTEVTQDDGKRWLQALRLKSVRQLQLRLPVSRTLQQEVLDRLLELLLLTRTMRTVRLTPLPCDGAAWRAEVVLG